MITRMKCRYFFLLVLIGASSPMQSSVIIPGNAEQETQTFSFPVAQFLGKSRGVVFTSAATSGAKDFALARFDATAQAFKPLAFEKVNLDGALNQTSPLYNNAIQHMTMLDGDSGGIVAVLNDTDPAAYLVSASHAGVILTTKNIKDAAGNTSAGIIGVEGSTIGRAFVAVKPNGGVFGDAGSGVNVVGTKQEKIKTGDTEQTTVVLSSLAKAGLFDKTAAPLMRTSPVQTLEAPVSMTWHDELQRVYVGAGNVIASNGALDGAQSVGMGINMADQLAIFPIFVENTNFTGLGNNAIIAAGSGGQLSVHHLAAVRMTTNRYYLIVVGGNGAPQATQSSAFAIPLVGSGDMRGFIASKNDITQPVQTVADMTISSDAAARVGGGALAAGPIHALSVVGDTVFATVEDGIHNGVYCSQPLFNADGTIATWTTWQRATSTTGSATAASLETTTGTFFVLTSDDQNDVTKRNVITRTQWGNGDSSSFAPVVAFANTYFTQDTGNVHAVVDVNDASASLDAVSMQFILGKDRIALVQTGVRDAGTLVPTQGSAYTQLRAEDGMLDQTPTDQTILGISGGVLTDVGPLTTASFVYSDTQDDTWLCVGGVRGVAFLQNQDSSGFGPALGANFNGAVAGMRFVQFGEYSYVQKIVNDDEYVYILTDTALDRVDMRNGLDNATTTRIARVQDVVGGLANAAFIDCVISDSLALLATSNGLFRIADGARVTDTAPTWQYVPVPEGEVPVMQLLVVSETGEPTDVAKNVGGMVYTLTGNAASDRTTINRFAIQATNGEPVTDTTVQPLAVDTFRNNIPSYFINYGEFKNLFVSDGAFVGALRNIHAGQPTTFVTPSLTRLPQSGFRFIGVRSKPGDGIVPNDQTILSIVRNSASGAWTFGGTLGLRVNE